MMGVNRIILLEMVRQLRTPYLVDPRRFPAGTLPDGFDAETLTDEQLEEIIVTNALGVPMTFPLSFQLEGGEWWLLPFEPQITLQGTNTIIKKPVSKGSVRGTIKERWAQGDYQLSISGILMGENSYPADDVKRLRSYCEAAKVLVKSPLLELFSINQIVIESWSVPHTVGVRNQAYTISALSDDIYRLLLRKEDLKQV